MARTKSSSRWLQEHFSDEFVRRAQADGLRSRAAYKLLEIDEKDRLFTPGMTVLDLGAAPGGWSQVAAARIVPGGHVIALDVLPLDTLADVTFIQGDFTQQEVLNNLLEVIDGGRVDLVMSDMAPNMSGMKAVDQPRSIYLCELALDLAQQVLAPGGNMLMKVFMGSGFEELLAAMRGSFERVVSRKPDASRARSREIYILARNYRVV